MGGGPGSSDPVTQERIGRGFNRFAFDRFREQEQTVVDLLAFVGLKLDVRVEGQLDPTYGAVLVSGGYFRVMDVNAALGRTLGDSDDRSGAPPVAVISDHYWWRRFGGDASVIGKTISVNNVSATIVGVLPSTFGGTSGRGGRFDIFVPLAVASEIAPGAADSWHLQIMGRLKPGVPFGGTVLWPACQIVEELFVIRQRS